MKKNRIDTIGALASIAILLSTGPAFAEVTAGYELNFDAQDIATAPGSSSWLSTTTNASQDFDFSGGTSGVTLETVVTGLSGISKAYRFTGGDGDADNPTWDGLFGDGDATTWEFWLKPADTGDAGQVIYESGGSGTGYAVWYEVGTPSDGMGTLHFTIDGGSGTQIETVSAVIDTSEFRQIVMVYDESAGGGSIDLMEIYVDGALVDDNLSSTVFDDASNDNDNIGIDDYSGSNGAGLGNANDSLAETVTDGEFEGDISIFRVYQATALTAPEVLANYQALSGPDTSAPEIVSLTPADDELDAPLGDLAATFNELLVIGSGDIRIVNDSDTVMTTIAIGDATQVTVSGATITVSPTVALIGGKAYHVELDAGVVEDSVGNPSAEILDPTVWNFSTDGTPPTLDSFANNKPGGQIYDNDSVIYTVIFNEAMNASTIEVADFGNSGSATATITVDSVTPVSDSIYEVVVTPTSTGTLQLQVNASANLEDVAGNALDTSSPIQDASVIDVISFTPNSASLEVGFQETVASEEFDAVDNTWGDTTPGRFYHISVNPNNTGYASYIALDTSNNPIPPYTRSFTGPVLGWSFIGGGTNGDLTVSEESGGLISWTTTDETDPVTNTFDSFGQNQKKFWNATDPGPDFNLPADETEEGNTTQDKNLAGYRSFGQATATIDVSGIDSGTLLIFYGAFSATPVVDAVLRDSSGLEPDVVLADLHLNGDAAQRTEFYAAEVEFATDGLYDTIVYNYLQPGGEPDGSGNGRSGGIVVLGPEVLGDYATWAAGFPEDDLTNPNADLDGDGWTNDDERLFGLDPTDPASQNPIVTGIFESISSTFSFTRRDDSLTQVRTIIETSTDLQMWTEDAGAVLIAGPPDANDIETVEVTLSPGLLTADTLFVRIVQGDLLTPLSENFESDDGGFTVDTTSGTPWISGDPDSTGPGGTVSDGNGESMNCFGTDIGNPGYYADGSTVTKLRSPVIDLTGVAGVTLTFAEAIDLKGGAIDSAVVNVIEDDSDAVIATAIYTADDSATQTDASWNNVGPIDLTPYVGQPVRIEWSFTGTDGVTNQYMGWYIDDVTVKQVIP